MLYRFESFELDAALHELRRDGTAVALERRVLDLLLLLVEHRDRVVSKQEILERIWPDVTVREHSISQAIYAARQALGDDPRSARFIRTVRGRGFRFVAEVEKRAARRGPPPGPGGAPPFVGREDILAELEDALESALAGRGRVVLISGEPGIGKTRLLEEFADRTRRRGITVHFGRCREDEGAPPFWPWVQLVRSELALQSDGRAAELVSSVPELAAHLPEFALPIPSKSLQSDTEARFRLFRSILDLWRTASASSSRVIALDDIHRSDSLSLHAFAQISAEIERLPVLLIAAHRETPVTRSGDFNRYVGETIRSNCAQLFPLQGFSEEETAEFISALLDAEASRRYARTLRLQAAGNPFFLRQLSRLVERMGDAPRAMPISLRESIVRHIEDAGRECRSMLSMASVLGREFSVSVLAAASGASEEHVVHCLHEAQVLGLVTNTGHQRGYLQFVHALLRDALYEQLAPSERLRMHARVVTALERRPAWTIRNISELAHHTREAAALVGYSKVALRCTECGRAAARGLALEEAERHFASAVEACEHGGVPDDLIVEALVSLGEIKARLGRREEARRLLAKASELATGVRLVDQLARAALAMSPAFFSIEVGVHDPEVVGLLSKAESQCDETNSFRARILSRLAMALYWKKGSEERRRQLIRDARAIVDQGEAAAAQLFVRAAAFAALWEVDNLSERMRTVTDLVDAAERLGDAEMQRMALVFRISTRMEGGDFGGMRRDVTNLDALVRRGGSPQGVWYRDLYQSMLAFMEGDLKRAEALARSMGEAGSNMGDQNALSSLGVITSSVRWQQDRISEVLKGLGWMVDAFPSIVAWRAAWGWMYALNGDRQAAEQMLNGVMSEGLGEVPKDLLWLISMSHLGDLAVELRARRHAAEILSALEGYGGRVIPVGYGVLCWGTVDRVLGRLCGVLGQWTRSERLFESAAATDSRMGSPLWLAQTRLAHGETLIAKGTSRDAAAAFEALRDALGLAQRLELRCVERRATASIREAAARMG